MKNLFNMMGFDAPLRLTLAQVQALPRHLPDTISKSDLAQTVLRNLQRRNLAHSLPDWLYVEAGMEAPSPASASMTKLVEEFKASVMKYMSVRGAVGTQREAYTKMANKHLELLRVVADLEKRAIEDDARENDGDGEDDDQDDEDDSWADAPAKKAPSAKAPKEAALTWYETLFNESTFKLDFYAKDQVLRVGPNRNHCPAGSNLVCFIKETAVKQTIEIRKFVNSQPLVIHGDTEVEDFDDELAEVLDYLEPTERNTSWMMKLIEGIVDLFGADSIGTSGAIRLAITKTEANAPYQITMQRGLHDVLVHVEFTTSCSMAYFKIVVRGTQETRNDLRSLKVHSEDSSANMRRALSKLFDVATGAETGKVYQFAYDNS